jgi:uncharacterized protein YoxC
MDAIEQSQVFFLISSIGFVVLGILAAIFIIYLLRAIKTFSRIMEKMEKDIDEIGDTTKEMIEDLKNSVVFNFLFRKKKKRPTIKS